MNVKQLINLLEKYNQEAEVLISSDEELNTLFNQFEVARLDDGKNQIVFYGLSGSEEEI